MFRIKNVFSKSDCLFSGLPRVTLTEKLQQWRGSVVQTLDTPGWNKCGRPKNGFVTLNGGIKMCARYREQHDSFVYGKYMEILYSDQLSTVKFL